MIQVNYGITMAVPKTIIGSIVVSPIATQATPTLATELIWLGISVPSWVGWLFFGFGLLFGSFLSTFQDSSVDQYINHKNLKPIYSFGFGLFFTLFGIPLYFTDITIWQLVLPAVVSSAIGAQMVYYMISSGKYIVEMVFKKIGIEPPPIIKHHTNDSEGNKE